MKVLLMTPLAGLLVEPPEIPDLGLGYLAGSLRKSGHEAYIRDWGANPSPDDLRIWLLENRPEVVGMKVFTKDVGGALKTISIVRSVLPDTIMIIGGPHPSAADPVDVMEEFTECDFAVKGEAEESLCLLLSKFMERRANVSRPVESGGKGHGAERPGAGSDCTILSDEEASGIPGLVWRTRDGVSFNPIKLNSDLDKIDFPSWDLINPKNYHKALYGSKNDRGYTAPIVTTRGCPGECTYCCAYHVNGRKIRFRSPKNIFEEILLLYNEYNVRQIMFMDNCFTSVRRNVVELCEMIIDHGLEIKWDFVSYENLDSLTDDTLALMYRAGCRMVHIGVESGCEKTRRLMKKHCNLEEINEKIVLANKHGILVDVYFMLGFPDETLTEMLQSIRYAFSLDAKILSFTMMFPLPGSDVYRHVLRKFGLKRIRWADFNVEKSAYPVSTLGSRSLAILIKMIRLGLRIRSGLNPVPTFS